MDQKQYKFFHHIGESNLLDESGIEAMEWLEESDEFRLVNLTNLKKYEEAQPINFDVEMDEQALQQKINVIKEKQKANATESSSKYKQYTDQEKSLFLYYHKFKLMKPIPAGRLAGINERTAQDWGKKLKNDPNWSIYEKQTNKRQRRANSEMNKKRT